MRRVLAMNYPVSTSPIGLTYLRRSNGEVSLAKRTLRKRTSFGQLRTLASEMKISGFVAIRGQNPRNT
ncbi:SAP domain-containing protein [Histoplasma ohiense]|nr:SAP domain-containing protein [Histoplasma ohiense (nom. inval.)]